MDFAYTAEDEAFRAELQAWLDANLPEFVDQGEIGDDARATRPRGRWPAGRRGSSG